MTPDLVEPLLLFHTRNIRKHQETLATHLGPITLLRTLYASLACKEDLGYSMPESVVGFFQAAVDSCFWQPPSKDPFKLKWKKNRKTLSSNLVSPRRCRKIQEHNLKISMMSKVFFSISHHFPIIFPSFPHHFI